MAQYEVIITNVQEQKIIGKGKENSQKYGERIQKNMFTNLSSLNNDEELMICRACFEPYKQSYRLKKNDENALKKKGEMGQADAKQATIPLLEQKIGAKRAPTSYFACSSGRLKVSEKALKISS